MKEFVESDYSPAELSEIEEMDSNVFTATEKTKFDRNRDKNQQRKSTDKPKYNKKPCPIRCSKGSHANGSLYFCNPFRNKSKEERKALAKKTHVCITCLSKTGPNHTCPVGPCASCGASHNILLCPKQQEGSEKVMVLNEDNNSDSDSDNYTEDDSHYDQNDSEQVFLVKRLNPKTSTPKDPDKSKPKGETEKGTENKPSTSVNKEGDSEEKKKQEKLLELTNFLKAIVKNQPKIKHIPTPCAVEIKSLTNEKPVATDRVCFLQCGITKETSELYDSKTEIDDRSGPVSDDEGEETEGEMGDNEEEDTDLEDSLEEEEIETTETDLESPSPSSTDGTEENEYDNGNESFGPAEETLPDLIYSSCDNSSESSDSEESDSQLITNSEDSEVDPDEDIDNGVFLVTSVTNLRRRQIFGLETSFEDKKKALDKI